MDFKRVIAAIIGLVFLSMMTMAQSVPSFEKRPVGSTGASVYLVRGSDPWEVSMSEDGSHVYTVETAWEDYNFACIVVQFDPPMTDGTPEEMEQLLISYMDFLQEQFGVIQTAGYGTGHSKSGVPEARGVVDYWTDLEGYEYVVKGWVNTDMLAVLFIYGLEEYSNFSTQQMFLNGFRFPGED